MNPVSCDSSLYVKRSSVTLKGLTGANVDDCLNDDTEELEKLTKQLLTKLDFKPRVDDNFDLHETRIATIEKGLFLLSQVYYTSNMTYDPKDGSFEEYCCYRAPFSWHCHTW